MNRQLTQKDRQVNNDIKPLITSGIRRAMRRRKMSQSELARRMGTSRMVVHRLLDEGDASLTVNTLSRAADALGARVYVRLQVPR